jgi:hypothetical protein
VCFFCFAGVWSQKTHKSKNFFPVPNHTDQKNFLKLPKKTFFSIIFIYTCFFNFFNMFLIRKSKKKVLFFSFAGVWSQKTHKSKNFFPVPSHTGQENFLKLAKKSFFSKIFIFTCFFNFFLMYLIRKKKKKVLF